jgi:hypothetical protein
MMAEIQKMTLDSVDIDILIGALEIAYAQEDYNIDEAALRGQLYGLSRALSTCAKMLPEVAHFVTLEIAHFAVSKKEVL